MLSLEQRIISDSFRFSGGMLNAAWVAGYLRNRDGQPFSIMSSSNNEDAMIPIHRKAGESIPRTYQERAPVRVIAHVSGRIAENGNRYPELTAIGYDFATVLDISLEAAFDAAFRQKSATEDEKFRPFQGKDSKLSSSANIVRIAGFVQAVSLKRATEESPARCTLLIRQREDESLSIPICYEGRLAEPVARRISRGMATKIVAAVQMTAEKQEDGSKIYMPRLVAQLPPGAVSRDDIRGVLPEWSVKMVEELKASRNARPAPASAKANDGVAIEETPPAPVASVLDQI